jgi:hypothetical protein
MRLNPQKIKCEKINQEKKSITQKNLRKKLIKRIRVKIYIKTIRGQTKTFNWRVKLN